MLIESKAVKIGIVGTGQRAQAFRRLIANNKKAELSMLCDHNQERLESFAHNMKCYEQSLTTDYEQMLSDEDLEAVIVTVPDFCHKEMAVKALNAGKHVMLEKPMALSVEDCREIIRAWNRSGKCLQIGFVLRCSSFYKKAKEIIDSGQLGQIMSICAAEYLSVSHGTSYMRRWHRKSSNSGSFVLAKCSHDLDLLSWLAGSLPARVASFGDNNFYVPEKQRASHCSKCSQENCIHRFDPETSMLYLTEIDRKNPSRNNHDLCVYNSDKDVVDNQVCIIEYSNGIKAQFTLGLFRAKGTRTIEVIGTKGYLSGDFSANRITLLDSISGKCKEFDTTPENSSGHGGSDQTFLDEFISGIIEDEQITVDVKSGMASTVVGVAIERSRIKGTVVNIEPSEYEL